MPYELDILDNSYRRPRLCRMVRHMNGGVYAKDRGMVAEVRISIGADSDADVSSFSEATLHLERAINTAPDELRTELVEAGARLISGLAAGEEPSHATDASQASRVVSRLAGDTGFTLDEEIAEAVSLLKRSFAFRRQLFERSLSNTEVANLLGTSRQTPHDRAAQGALLAVKDYSGALRYPLWQFDPEGPGGVVEGLPAVLRTLDLTPWEKAGWLSQAHPVLDGTSPIDALRQGRLHAVLDLARAVGAV